MGMGPGLDVPAASRPRPPNGENETKAPSFGGRERILQPAFAVLRQHGWVILHIERGPGMVGRFPGL